MASKLSKHDRAAIVLHGSLVELAKAARAERDAPDRVSRLRVQSHEADALFKAERAFRAFQHA